MDSGLTCINSKYTISHFLSSICLLGKFAYLNCIKHINNISLIGGNMKTFSHRLEKCSPIFPVWESHGILNILEKSGNFYPKCWKSQGILDNFYFLSDILIEVYLLNRFYIC